MPTHNTKNVADRARSLRDIIADHDYHYHVLDRPQISDYEYDKLLEELHQIESNYPELKTPDSPTQRVGGSVLNAFEKMTHRKPMLSLQNSYSADDLLGFDERLKKILENDRDISYFCEPKFDGLAIELIYEHGLLTAALTRGDGVVGENVTENIKTIKSLPLKLRTSSPPPLLEVRGEVLILKNDFLNMNESLQEEGLQPFANPRNAAAGSIRQLDSTIAAARPLKIFCYAPGQIDGLNIKTQDEFILQLTQYGLPTSPLIEVCSSVKGAVTFYNRIQKQRYDLPFEIDGVVIKVNDWRAQDTLGQIARSPRWATAVKYKPEQGQTIINDIVVQVGRTGALTPVAIMEPVKVGGVTITHATLHNQQEIDRKNIRVGDSVTIQRAGDVIPEIVSVDLSKRMNNSCRFIIPSRCPRCNEKTENLGDEVISRCVNPSCPAIIAESLKHFVSRRAMNIDKVGDKIVDQLIDAKLVTKFSDFYSLKKEMLLKLERQGEKSAQNIINSIEQSKTPTLARFIYSLGIRHVGEQTGKILAQRYQTLDAWLNTTEEDLIEVTGIGDIVARSIAHALKDSALLNDVDRMIKLGIKIQPLKQKTSQTLTGQIFVITGSHPIPRDDIKSAIEANGGKTSSSVSKKINYLIAGEDAGSKLEKALELGIPTITWEEFKALLKK